MSETKKEKQLAGSTTAVPASKPSSKNMRDGEEPDDMLLALLWSPTETLVSRDRAVLATANYHGQLATVIILVGTELTPVGIKTIQDSKVVGTANNSECQNKVSETV